MAAPVIDEVQFPTQIGEGATGGPTFSTVVIVAGNGLEQRVPLYAHGRYEWNAATGLKSPTDMKVITAFFLCRQGRARGFRWKDWDDYIATDEPLTIDGTPTAQLVKTYSSGAVSYVRTIFKPQQNIVPVTIKRNSSPYAAFTLDTTTGIVTWNFILQNSITNITQATSAVLTIGAHSFVNGDVVFITGVSGMTQINNLTGTVTGHDATHITVNINSTGFFAYTSGGTVSKYPQPTDVVTWSGQFDVPVRFDQDVWQMMQTASQIREVDSVAIIELLG
jgi:uncharacterized protein (TIGR02217 family)